MLKNLSDKILLEKFFAGIKVEANQISENVAMIAEIDSRRLYLKYRQPSLFAFLTRHAGYTNGTAQTRIDTARLMVEVPQIQEDLKLGDLNLMQAAMVARYSREAAREGKTVDIEKKQEILAGVKNKDLGQSEQIIAKELGIKPKEKEKKRTQGDGSLRLSITFSKEDMEVLNEVKANISHKHPSVSMKQLIMIMAGKLTKKPTTKLVVRKSKNPNYVAAQVRREIFAEHQGCQWVDPNTGEKCGSPFQPQIDHKISKWLGGTSEKSNLQQLCSGHNQLKYEMEVAAHFGFSKPEFD